MTAEEYDNTAFFCGMKAKIADVWHVVESADFENRSVNVSGEDYYCFEIQGFSRPNETK